jgi:hypothetical protein
MLEIRDRCTTTPVIAIKTIPENDDERRFYDRAGFGDYSVVLINMAGGAKCESDCFKWQDDGSRTMFHAHRYIADNFDDICDKSVIDVEYILDERKEPKKSEIWR